MNKDVFGKPEQTSNFWEGDNWIYLALTIVVGITTAMVVPAITTQQLHPLSLLLSVVLATAAFSAIWWRRRHSVLQGAGIGLGLGVLMYLFALLVGFVSAGIAST